MLNAMVAKSPQPAGRARAARPARRGPRLDRPVGGGRGRLLRRRPGRRSRSTKVWQGYIAAKQGDWAAARQAFAAGAVGHRPASPPPGAPASARPTPWRRWRPATCTPPAPCWPTAFSQNAPAADQLTARLVQARLFELDGQTDRALAVYKAVGPRAAGRDRHPGQAGRHPAVAGQGRDEARRGRRRSWKQLKWRWRGDATELAVIRTAGRALSVAGPLSRGAGRAARRRQADGDLPGAAELQADLSNAFRALFLDGGADGLQPIQALAPVLRLPRADAGRRRRRRDGAPAGPPAGRRRPAGPGGRAAEIPGRRTGWRAWPRPRSRPTWPPSI